MRVACTTTFLHGMDRFETGDIRTVPDEVGAYFIKQKWAHEVAPQVSSGESSGCSSDSCLHIQDGRIGFGDTNNG